YLSNSSLGLQHAAGAGAAEDVFDRPLGDQRLALAQAVVLSQRVTLELFVEQNAAEVGVAGEANAVKVPDQALPPVGALQDAGRGGNLGAPVGDANLEPEVLVAGDREEKVADLEAGVVDRQLQPIAAVHREKEL